MPTSKTTQGKTLAKKLFLQSPLAHDKMSDAEKKKTESLRLEYKSFLDNGKTERECAHEMVARAKKAGFVPIDTAKAGDKVYMVYRDKCVGLAVFGKKPVIDGVNLHISHTDSPRLDLKQRPIYEDSGLALAKTHYYGGIKKYQWVTIPLALHGVAYMADGGRVDVVIGEKEDDPVFTVLDLLPHLAKNAQYPKKLDDIVPGEKLNVLIGGIPYGGEKDKDRFKLTVLDLLNRGYGLTEEDLISAEFEVVPAGRARDVGLDRAFIGAYGHDDRVSAFSGMAALFDAKPKDRTAVVISVDKEEIGSTGNTGAQGRFVLEFLAELLALQGENSERAIRKALGNSNVLSADVNAGLDPDWKEVHDRKNAAEMGKGIVMTKYTGSRGKGGASDASAEFVSRIRNIWNQGGVVWQTAELGKVDEGGGGTVAMFLARHGAEVLDAGPAVLSMHAPMEILHVCDLFQAYKAYRVFLEKA